jgi:hypothetical protein
MRLKSSSFYLLVRSIGIDGINKRRPVLLPRLNGAAAIPLKHPGLIDYGTVGDISRTVFAVEQRIEKLYGFGPVFLIYEGDKLVAAHFGKRIGRNFFLSPEISVYRGDRYLIPCFLENDYARGY